MIHCKCIVRACNVAGKKASIVNCIKHVHPYYHLQRHPCWALALKEQILEDYDDFPFDNTPSLQSEPSNPQAKSDEEEFDPAYIPVLRSKYHDQVHRIPGKPQRITKLRQEFAKIENAVERGGKDAYKRAMGRLLQLQNELDGIFDKSTGEGVAGMRPPQTKEEARYSKDDLSNKSGLKLRRGGGEGGGGSSGRGGQGGGRGAGRGVMSSGRGGRGGGRGRGSGRGGRGGGNGVTISRGPCPYCIELNRHSSDNIRFDHDELNCTRANEYSDLMDSLESNIKEDKQEGGEDEGCL